MVSKLTLVMKMTFFASSSLVLALFKKFCKRDFCDEVRDFKIPEPEAVAS